MKLPRSEYRDPWLEHPYTKLVAEALEPQIREAVNALIRRARDSSDVKVVRAVCEYDKLVAIATAVKGRQRDGEETDE